MVDGDGGELGGLVAVVGLDVGGEGVEPGGGAWLRATIRFCVLRLRDQLMNRRVAPRGAPRVTNQKLRMPGYWPDFALRSVHGTPW